MQLTLFTDYSLRTLLYLGANPSRPVPIAEIAAAYAVSAHHIAKVGQGLVGAGLVRARRGRAGGLELAVPPASVRIGAVVRRTEPTIDPLECFDREASDCPILAACRLKHTLRDARDAFLEVLDRTTLADLLTPALTRRLARPLPIAAPRAPRRARTAAP